MDKILLKQELDDIVKSNILLFNETEGVIKSIEELKLQNIELNDNLKSEVEEQLKDLGRNLDLGLKNTSEEIKLIKKTLEDINKIHTKLNQEHKDSIQRYISDSNKSLDKSIDSSRISVISKISDAKMELTNENKTEFYKINENINSQMNKILQSNNEKFEYIVEHQNKTIDELNIQISKKNLWLKIGASVIVMMLIFIGIR